MAKDINFTAVSKFLRNFEHEAQTTGVDRDTALQDLLHHCLENLKDNISLQEYDDFMSKLKKSLIEGRN